jgi:plasmid stabilization system protein ParE
MSYRIVFLAGAESDMDNIEEYLSQFYASTVRNFFVQLKKQVLMLEDMPYMCPAYENDPYFRRMIINDYLLFYSVDEKRQLVLVHRIFHSSRDISRQILAHRPETKKTDLQ